MKRNSGLTIVQLMLILFVAGLAGKFLVDYIIERRCAGEYSASAPCAK